ncbi:DUF1295 domain-containing protein [Lutimonas saemankumensis]|uniref:DUF1295 domain-containing protein n=1 Tax=Lutimonas saemankumensis TaxID=483016 RepID=UPI001CD6A625|nr:DUF1295 domain-containing protein [Lutimonas saemankumensis]MCA0930870.1 DUF1295 domain-containing protein [Lutimonas saemankumensis]
MIMILPVIGVFAMMTLLWLFSIYLKNVSIVDNFWGMGFVLVVWTLALQSEVLFTRNYLLILLVTLWGIRLSFYLMHRNYGKEEDYRYQEFRERYGRERYWWFSYFQVFLLQGGLILIIALPFLGVFKKTISDELNFIDYTGVLIWVIGFVFESVGDYQLASFKKNPANKGKLLTHGLWRYTRHPNYFGDAAVWWGYGLIAIASGAYWYSLGAVLMTYLILKISGVSLLEKSLSVNKPGYEDYIKRTSSFIPWFPKRKS